MVDTDENAIKVSEIDDINSYELDIIDMSTKTDVDGIPPSSGISIICSISDKQFACGFQSGTIGIWDLETSKALKYIDAHDSYLGDLKSFDKSKLISCSDEIIKIWNLQTYQCVQVIYGHSSPIFCLDLTLDGNLLSCSSDKKVKLWRIETGTKLKSTKFEDSVFCVKMLDDDLIAVGLSNGKILIYDLIKNKIVKTILTENNTSGISRFNFLSNGNLLSGSYDGAIRKWKIFD